MLHSSVVIIPCTSLSGQHAGHDSSLLGLTCEAGALLQADCSCVWWFLTTSSEPAYLPDLAPLAALQQLRKLHLGSVELGRYPAFSRMTQLRDLALYFCDQGPEPLSVDEINQLITQASAESLSAC